MLKIKINEDKKYVLDTEQNKKVMKGAGLALAGAIISIILQNINLLDLGKNQVFVAMIVSVVCNYILKVIKQNE